MWRLWNKLFGWHYVRMYYGGSPEIFRIVFCRIGREKTVRVNYYGDEFILFPPSLGALKISTGVYRDYIPLTFKPEELIK